LDNLVANEPKKLETINTVLNNSFGMVGINSVVIIKKMTSV